ncbi:glycine cleavage system t protein [Lucifera butyrica]|uniref:Aminomethyltransferase n=1 Tax=Lucifera butyrica TaxID=1351585 RepID=A0A498RBN3_9FIRM|nr:glycine cleavage system aminomethyltransferase GcvT [Lucifera butyrica]VBB08350.1 glycine cleavage system t protein [Lucifera butyrica]
MVRQTPLYEAHGRYGGKFVEFGGWLLPVQYAGILEEHRAVRQKAGLFDVSHMGEVRLTGPAALALVQRLVTNDASRLQAGQVQYSPMCYPEGGVVDDVLIYKQADEDYLLVVNAANTGKDWDWIRENAAGLEVTLQDLSAETAQLALQGPAAPTILSGLTTAPLGELPYYHFISRTEVAGKNVLLSRTGYTGEDGFEIYCATQDAVFLWDSLMSAGEVYGLQPAGLGCRDTLRFEACMPLYGHELSAGISPIEAGLGRYVKTDKGNFHGRKILADQKQNGTRRTLVGFEMLGRGIARAEYPILYGEKRIGTVTTGSYAPSLDKNLGLGLVDSEFAPLGQHFDISIRGKSVPAQVIPKPFYKRKGN